MSLFVVTREAGPNWTEGKGAFEQPAVNDHEACMNSLAAAFVSHRPVPGGFTRTRSVHRGDAETYASEVGLPVGFLAG